MRAPSSLPTTPTGLEPLFAHDEPIDVPSGVFRGRVLCRLDTPGARDRLWAPSQKVAFEWLPFGVDFDRRLWFFFEPRFGVGRFEPRVERSRWRDTDVVTLRYDVSRLPRPVRRVLYDEVKPLDGDRLLGIGGINAGPGRGDHFFFALERMG